jgi:predicted outer membrane protein
MRMRRFLWGAGLLAIMGLGVGCAHDEAKQAHSRGEKVGAALAEKVRFADQLSLLNQEQIALGQLALRNSDNPEVQRFAQDLIRDHKRNQEELETLAKSKTMSLAVVNLSTEDMAVGGAGMEGVEKGVKKGSEKYDKKFNEQVSGFLDKRNQLASLSGHEFDKAFLAEVKKGQERGEKLIDQGLDDYHEDTTLAVFLGRTAPVISGHQQQLETLRGLLGE